ncbi:hypothetical protein PhCBS80983_g00985 [Powellomyces hirtus]|uniref:HhH-GPD domain-containing protein n=1 Tax=Powellomyces hirtus TaxID=109895 RepID=A0A507EE59_9FUNG|nr:hypothetical protein PhCBS80983_g00985 [Powellomyces hirtus]
MCNQICNTQRTVKRKENNLESKPVKKRSIKEEPVDRVYAPALPFDAPADVGITEIDTVPSAFAVDSAALPKPEGGFSFTSALAHMYKQDPNLEALIEKSGKPCRIFENPGLGQESSGLNSFKALTRAIVYQQLSGKAAASIMRKWLLVFGDERASEPDSQWFPTPQQVRSFDQATYRAAGFSNRKAEYVHALADKYIDGSITDEKLLTMNDEQISELLCSVRGIGQWTVDMFLMFDLKRPNILPVGDLGIRKGMSMYFQMKGAKGKGKSSGPGNGVYLPTPMEMIEAAEIWEPYRTIASYYMWTVADTKTVDDA